MPELPEVESARVVIERSALDRPIVAVDDSDGYVCRPHASGQIADALVGAALVAAHRQGKTLWCDTTTGPVLGVHLGMSGKIVIAAADGTESDGGDHWEFGRQPGDYRHSRFSLTFADGTILRLLDPRRFGRIRLDPPRDQLGPDAATISAAQFSAATKSGRTPVKARLLDQNALSGVGNLLADQILWQARINPARTVDSLTNAERKRLYRALGQSVGDALRHGGVHTLSLVPQRRRGGHCELDGTALRRSAVGGRTTFWCPAHQPEFRPTRPPEED